MHVCEREYIPEHMESLWEVLWCPALSLWTLFYGGDKVSNKSEGRLGQQAPALFLSLPTPFPYYLDYRLR